jgi:hypothetical protein
MHTRHGHVLSYLTIIRRHILSNLDVIVCSSFKNQMTVKQNRLTGYLIILAVIK